jgi:hypothetical protein
LRWGGAHVAQPREHGLAGINEKVVLLFEMLVQGPQMGAVQVQDAAAALAAEQEACPVPVLVVAVLVKGALLRADLVDVARRLQPLQLAVDGGQAHGTARGPQLLRQLVDGDELPAPPGQTLQHGLLLPGGIRHALASKLKMKIIFIL